MKTPREILLARHGAIEPKLDAVRHAVVAAIRHPEPANARTHGQPADSLAGTLFRTLWHELILPCRQVWKGLAAVWLILFILNVAQRHGSGTGELASGPSAPMVLAYYQQEKMLNELLTDRVLPVDADRPRSEINRGAAI
jgi:hypothetical protein